MCLPRAAVSGGRRRQLVGLHPRQRRVENRVLSLVDRRVRVVDREECVGFGVVGPGLGHVEVDLGLLAVDVLADCRDVLVPCPLNVVPPVRDLRRVRLGRLAQALSLSLSRRAGVVDLSL
jgi:hypothetical protein